MVAALPMPSLKKALPPRARRATSEESITWIKSERSPSRRKESAAGPASRSDDRVALPIGPVGALAERGVETPHRVAAGPLAQEREHRMNETGEAADDHLQAETGRLAGMLAIAFAGLVEMADQMLVRHAPS